MRRIRPQRPKTPELPRNMVLSSEIPRHRQSNSWTTFADIHKRRNKGLLAQDPDNSSSGNTLEMGNKDDSGNPHRNSGNTGTSPSTRKLDRTLQKQRPIVDDNDDGFEPLSDIDDFFEEKPYKKQRSSEGAGYSNQASRHQFSTSQTGGRNRSQGSVTTILELPPIQEQPAIQAHVDDNPAMDDTWLSSDPIEDSVDFNTSRPARKPNASTTRSMLSSTACTTDEIEELLLEDSPTPNSSIQPDDSFDMRDADSRARKMSGTSTFPQTDLPFKCIDVTDNGNTVNKNGSTPVDDARDRMQTEVQMKFSNEGREYSMDSMAQVPFDRQGSSLIRQQQSSPPLQLFDLPLTTDALESRLNVLQAQFRSTVDNILDSIRGVDLLHSSLKESLLDHKRQTDEQTKRIRVQVRDIQKEATLLHSKAKVDLGYNEASKP
ncbi:hypothetical protein BGZ50_008375 [Haplosporangium sp. Z 11]|nr:hypothetical protein BGZ50_008375 [Haplosporangium sp. Z 11]